MPRHLFPLCLVVLLASCGSPSSPASTAVDLSGRWGGTPAAWQWSEASVADGLPVRSSACPGTLDLTSQPGGTFQGRYRIECASAGVSAGDVVDGRIDATGRISFRLVRAEGWDPAVIPGWFDSSCRAEGDPDTYEGSLREGAIDARRFRALDCPGGRVTASSAFNGRR